MKNLIKMIFLFFIILISGCENNLTNPEETYFNNGFGYNCTINSIYGKIQNWTHGDSLVVKLVVQHPDTSNLFFTAGTSTISSSGKFNISNLKDMPSNFLSSHFSEMDDSLSIENPDARFSTTVNYLSVQNNRDEEIGALLYSDFPEDNYVVGVLVFSTNNTKINGTLEHMNINLELKKGWNIYYYIMSQNSKTYLTTDYQGVLLWNYLSK